MGLARSQYLGKSCTKELSIIDRTMEASATTYMVLKAYLIASVYTFVFAEVGHRCTSSDEIVQVT